MAHWGYLPLAFKFLSNIERPRVLEIGVEHGLTTIPLLINLMHTHDEFLLCGVDILFQERLKIMMSNIELVKGKRVDFYIMNSLEFLKKTQQDFDLVFLDGDHNYHTVSQELELLLPLLSDQAIMIVDDYHGRWSEHDLWYAERDGYEGDETQEIATKKVETEKHGVKAAVDEFLVNHKEWTGMVPVKGEPIMLVRKSRIREAKSPGDLRSFDV